MVEGKVRLGPESIKKITERVAKQLREELVEEVSKSVSKSMDERVAALSDKLEKLETKGLEDTHVTDHLQALNLRLARVEKSFQELREAVQPAGEAKRKAEAEVEVEAETEKAKPAEKAEAPGEEKIVGICRNCELGFTEEERRAGMKYCPQCARPIEWAT